MIPNLAALHPQIVHFMLQADAFEALGQKDAAIAVLQATVSQTPNARVQQRIDQLQGKTS